MSTKMQRITHTHTHTRVYLFDVMAMQLPHNANKIVLVFKLTVFNIAVCENSDKSCKHIDYVNSSIINELS